MENQRFKQQGAFSWCELTTTDTAAAKQFYSQLLGWSTEDMPMTLFNTNYTVLKAGDTEVGGIMRLPENMPGSPWQKPAWGCYVTVDDVDGIVEQVKTLGGKVLLFPQDISKVGRFAMIEDPQGATLGLITYFPEVLSNEDDQKA